MRIPTERLDQLAKAVLKRDRFSGGDLARELGIDYQLLWAYLNRTGLPVENAGDVASTLEKWADDLRAIATDLRADVDLARRGLQEPAPTPADPEPLAVRRRRGRTRSASEQADAIAATGA